MAIILQNYAGRPNICYAEFYCDYISEIELLPTTTNRGKGEYSIYDACPMSSSCYCFEDGAGYCLSSSGWKKL